MCRFSLLFLVLPEMVIQILSQNPCACTVIQLPLYREGYNIQCVPQLQLTNHNTNTSGISCYYSPLFTYSTMNASPNSKMNKVLIYFVSNSFDWVAASFGYFLCILLSEVLHSWYTLCTLRIKRKQKLSVRETGQTERGDLQS